MKEKLLWLTVVVIFGAMLTASRAQSLASKTDIGRFQFYRFQATDATGATTWKLDTATGQVWSLGLGKTPEGKATAAWHPIPENAVLLPDE